MEGSATTYVEVPVDWTEYSYDLSAYAGQTIQLAINCVSSDAFALFIDDINVSLPSEWSTSIAVSTPYQIEGLTPETNYIVQVQAVYTTPVMKKRVPLLSALIFFANQPTITPSEGTPIIPKILRIVLTISIKPPPRNIKKVVLTKQPS